MDAMLAGTPYTALRDAILTHPKNVVIGIQRQDGRMEFNPEPETSIRSGDRLVVLGRPDSLKRLEAEAC